MATTHPMPPTSATTPMPFVDDCKQVLQGLRGVLTEALGSVGVDAARPQEVARQLGLHRNLTWKLSKIIKGTNVFAAIPHIPGRNGMEILAKALRKAGASDAGLRRIQDAMDDFDRLVQEHGGDRATLELVAGGFVPGSAQHEALLQARRYAFRGNSATWSVQARVLLSINILAPSPSDPRRVDLAQVHGMVDFVRLRPDVVWPLFRRLAWDDSGSTRAVVGQPIEPGAEDSGVPLLRSFCSPDMPELNVIRSEMETEYELPAGQVGRSAELTCIYGSLLPSLGSQYAEGDDRVCEMGCNLVTPVELMHSDLLVHESLSWAMHPRADVYSLLEGRPVHGRSRREASRLPIETDVHELGQGLVTMATPHVPRYGELLAHVFECLGWDDSAFRGFRVTLDYPPLPAVAMLSMDLLPEE